MYVVSWISFDDAVKSNNFYYLNFGGWFGINDDKQYTGKRCDFRARHRWCDYIDRSPNDIELYLEAIRVSVVDKYVSVDKAMKHNGIYHQRYKDGVPLFSDGKAGVFSRNAWGDLMAAIWTEVSIENDIDSYNEFGLCAQYCYYDFR